MREFEVVGGVGGHQHALIVDWHDRREWGGGMPLDDVGSRLNRIAKIDEKEVGVVKKQLAALRHDRELNSKVAGSFDEGCGPIRLRGKDDRDAFHLSIFAGLCDDRQN